MINRIPEAVCILVVLASVASAQPATWPLVEAPGHFAFPLPPSLELAEGTFKSSREGDREILLVEEERFTVRAQPKGMNAAEAEPDRMRSAAIVVDIERGEPGTFAPLGADMTMSAEDLQQFDDELHTGFLQQAEESGEISDISWTGADVVQLEGTQAIRLRYSGKMGAEDATFVVNMYMIQNHDSMYYVTISYLLEEQAKWVDDLRTAFGEMRFEARG